MRSMNVNKQKSEAYKKLVELMKETYPKFDYSFDPADTNIPPQFWAPYVKINDKMTCICNEINLYTYWQGLGYADKTPKIKYLLVGQDFGNIFRGDNTRIREINSGNKSLPYFDKTDDPTDINLMELFKILGYNDVMKRHDELFFTNFCLAYRTGSQSGGITKKVMNASADLFKKLCLILEPKNILCLGKMTFECVYQTLKAKKDKGFKKLFDEDQYNEFIVNHGNGDIKVQINGKPTTIYPLAHCGAYGTMNRNRITDPRSKNDPLINQREDWEKIAANNN